MSFISHIAFALADAFRSGKTNAAAMDQRGIDVMGYSSQWLTDLSKSIAENKTLLDNSRNLKSYIETFPALIRAFQQGEVQSRLVKYYLPSEQMLPNPSFIIEGIPVLNNHAELLAFLGVDNKRLHSLSKPWLSAYQNEPFPLQNYRYRWIKKAKKHQYRLIEIPKPNLKAIQRNIAKSILNKIPVHPNAYAYRCGQSIKACVTGHQNKRWVLKMDMQNFFVSISYARVYAVFCALGYPGNICRILALLTTNICPEQVLRVKIKQWRERQKYHIPHLPQGAPSSPQLSNLVALNMDCRLSALANKLSIDYSRYADDLFFSGNRKQEMSQLIALIGSIVAEEGFQINFRKTRVLGSGQQQKILGIVVNKGTNLARREYDCLKAILNNSIRYGAESQAGVHNDFYAYLKGKIAFVKMLNPNKGLKLEGLFKQISWK